MLFSIGPAARVGLTYLSPVRLDFESTPELSGLSPALEAILASNGLLGRPLTIGMTLPQTRARGTRP